nr:hypothetical protein [Tanacetum cinerariifolium]
MLSSINGSFPVGVHGPFISSESVLVLVNSCVAERDLSNHVMGKVKDGEALDLADNVDSFFGRKRLCIKTKLPLSILESFKGPNDDRVSDVEEVSETNFRDNLSIPINHIDELEKQQSADPFNIYRLLRKQPGDDSHEASSSLSHPPGFTPDVSVIQNENGQSAKEIPVVVNAKVMNNSQDVYKEASCDNVDPNVVKKGGSVLGVMEDMIRVGKAMGYSMDGCVKDLEQIIGTQGVGDVPR